VSDEPAVASRWPAFRQTGRRPLGLWQHRDFLLLWNAQGISSIGSQITILALPLTAILVLQASAFEVALLGTAATCPASCWGFQLAFGSTASPGGLP
jgi:hypothetical protein